MVIAICQYKVDDSPSKDLKIAKITKQIRSPYVGRWFRQQDGRLNENSSEFRTSRRFQETMGTNFFLELVYD